MIVGQATAIRSPMSGGPFIPLFVITIALTLTTLGLVMLFSAGAVTKSGPYALVSKQAIWLGLSIVAGGVAAFVNLEWLRKRAWLLYGICALALVLVLVPGFGVKVNGAQRWLGLGTVRARRLSPWVDPPLAKVGERGGEQVEPPTRGSDRVKGGVDGSSCARSTRAVDHHLRGGGRVRYLSLPQVPLRQ